MMFKEERHIVKPLYEYLKILPVSLNNRLLQGKFIKNRIVQEHPVVIFNKYPLVYSSSIKTSDQTKLITPYFRTSAGVSSLAYQRCKTWNAIPSPNKQLENKTIYKNNTKNTCFWKSQNKIPVTDNCKYLCIIDELY